MVFTSYPNKPIIEILSCGNVTHLVSVVFNNGQYAVLYYDIVGHMMTVYDGLNVSIKKWQDHIIHTVKTYGFQLPLVYSLCKYQEDVNHEPYGRRTRRVKSMVLEIDLNNSKSPWLVKNLVTYLLVGPGRYSGPVSSTLEILITPHTDLPGQF